MIEYNSLRLYQCWVNSPSIGNTESLGNLCWRLQKIVWVLIQDPDQFDYITGVT